VAVAAARLAADGGVGGVAVAADDAHVAALARRVVLESI
jgi:hypothetical protein